MTTKICWTTNGKIVAGKLGAFRSLAARLSERVESSEPGTLTYQFFLIEDESEFDTIELFEDSAAALTHLEGFLTHAEEFMSCVVLEGFYVYGDPSEELKGTIEDWQPSYYSQIAGFTR